MGVFAGPEINESGLVLAVDAGNIKSYDKYENLYTYSENLATWNTDGVTTVTTDQTTSPNNDNTADKMVGPYVYRYFTSSGSPVASGTTVTASVFVKNNGANTFNFVIYCLSASAFSSSVNLTTGTISGTGASIQAYPNGWYRISLTSTINSASCYLAIEGLGGSGASQSLYIWGAQVERSSTVSDYYSTAASTKSRGTTWTDMSGNSITGTLTNGPTYNSSNGGSIVFDGVDDYIIIPENSALNTQTPTVEVWVKTNATTQNGFWFEKGQVNTQYALFQEGSVIQWRQNFSGSVTNLSTTTATYMNTTSWYQIVGTYTSGSRKLYINGTLVNSDGQGGTISTNSNGMSIGVYGGYNPGGSGRGYYYNGNVAVCKVYNRELSATEVSQNFNALRGRFGI